MRIKAVLGWFVFGLVITFIVIDYYVRHEVRRQVRARVKDMTTALSEFNQLFTSKAGDNDDETPRFTE